MSTSQPVTRLRSTMVGKEGPLVVFAHGLFGRGRNFSGIAKALQPGYRALMVDLPNHGASDWTDHVDYAQMAEALAEHLRSTVPDDLPVHLVGHSMGGKVAMMLALTAPELLASLVVVDISPTGSGSASEFEFLLGALKKIDLDALESLGDADRALAKDVPQPTLRGFLLQNLRRDRDAGTFSWQPNLDLLLSDLPVIIDDIPHQDRVFDGPVLWIAGDESPYVTDEQAPTMRALFPSTRLVTIKGAGHWVHSQQPKVFTATLRYFLDAVTKDASA
ncbi:alpha/beta fold hydrolase [Ornithinimicrobium panacihumi]|uniref:alpha/beta fold hydrolase n=1 Tax=Ornithinimicrobium panacihumi TaxID=2008449 RepID=UPI003F89A03E